MTLLTSDSLLRRYWPVLAGLIAALLVAILLLLAWQPRWRANVVVQLPPGYPASISAQDLLPDERAGPLLQRLGAHVEARPRRLPVMYALVAGLAGSEGVADAAAGLDHYAWGREEADISDLVSARQSPGELLLVAGEGMQFDLITGTGNLVLRGQVGELAFVEDGEVALRIAAWRARQGLRFDLYRHDLAATVLATRENLQVVREGQQVLRLELHNGSRERAARLVNAIADELVARLASSDARVAVAASAANAVPVANFWWRLPLAALCGILVTLVARLARRHRPRSPAYWANALGRPVAAVLAEPDDSEALDSLAAFVSVAGAEKGITTVGLRRGGDECADCLRAVDAALRAHFPGISIATNGQADPNRALILQLLDSRRGVSRARPDADADAVLLCRYRSAADD